MTQAAANVINTSIGHTPKQIRKIIRQTPRTVIDELLTYYGLWDYKVLCERLSIVG